MADKTLAQITPATSVNLTDTVYLVQGNNSRRGTVQQLKTAIAAETAAAITVDDTNLQVAVDTNLQALLEKSDTALLNARSTGVRYGGDLTAGTGLNVNVSVGAGQIMDNTDPVNPVFTAITWNAQTVTILNSGITWLYLDDDSGVVKQDQVEPGYELHSKRVYLGRVGVAGGTLIAVSQDKDYIQNLAAQLRAFANAIGQIRLSGLTLSANGANLSINVAAGVMFDFGVNGIDNPHEISISSLAPAAFQYYLRAGNASGTNLTSLNVAQYDNAGVLASVPANRYTIQDVYVFSSGNVRIQYGQNLFTSLADAVNGARVRTNYVLNPVLDLGLRIGGIAVKGDATDLTNAAQAQFVPVNKFGTY